MIPESEYDKFVKEMAAIHAIQSFMSRRQGMEMIYYQHHKARGVKLRGKYRPR